jgi:hypothetical protein
MNKEFVELVRQLSVEITKEKGKTKNYRSYYSGILMSSMKLGFVPREIGDRFGSMCS